MTGDSIRMEGVSAQLRLPRTARRLLFLLLFLGAVADSDSVLAQDDTTYYSVYSFYEAAADADWRTCALLTHPDELVRFKKGMLETLDLLLPSPYYQDAFAQEFFLLPSFYDIRKVEPFGFYIKMMAAVARMSPGWLATLRTMELAVGDYVAEGDSLRHYIVWQIYPIVNSSLEELCTFTLRKSGEEWLCTLTGPWDPGKAKFLRTVLGEPKAEVRVD